MEPPANPSELIHMLPSQERDHLTALARCGLVLAFFGFLVLRAQAASKATDDKPPIPRDLHFESKPIPDEDNAIYLWRRAARTLTKPDDKTSEAIAYAWKPESRAPGDDERAAMQHWLRQNHESLELMELSLKKPAAKWLAKRGEEEQPELFALVQLTKARMVTADYLAIQGKWEEAAELLEGNLRLAQIAIESEAAMIHYLVGAGVRTTTQRAMVRLANHRATPLRMLDRLSAALPPLNSDTNAYSRLLNVEFTVYAYPGLDVKWFAEAWAKPEARTIVSLTYDEEFQRPFMVLTDPGLVALHPKPFDQLTELQRASDTYRRYRTNALAAWTNRVDADEAAIEKVQTEFMEEIEPLMELVADDELPLNQKGVAKARKLYLAISDPIGRVLQCRNSVLSADDRRVFKNRTEREAVRAIIGAIRFERQKDQLPASLAELPGEPSRAAVPWDYFADAPLNYSKEKRLIWSVGEDAEDDEADGSPEAPWSGLDAVWKIPNRIK
jgi:hypothetical protein